MKVRTKKIRRTRKRTRRTIWIDDRAWPGDQEEASKWGRGNGEEEMD